MVNCIENAVYLNEGFKRSIEFRNDQVYKEVDRAWHLSGSLAQLRNFAIFIGDYLQREYQRRSSRAEKKQSNALFLISVLQIIALTSVWADYLSLLNMDELRDVVNEGVFSVVFGDAVFLQIFNAVVPVMLVVVSVAVL